MRTKLVFAGLVAVALAAAGGASFANEASSPQGRTSAGTADKNQAAERTACDPVAASSALSATDGVGGEPDAVQTVTHTLLELGNEACFAGFVIDEQNGQVTSYWKGDLPAPARAYAESQPEGLEVVVNLKARYSRAELRAAAARLQAANVFDTVGGVSVGVPSDGSGLKLWLNGEQTPSETQVREISEVTGVLGIDLNIATDAGDLDTSIPQRIDQSSDLDTTIPERIG
ncbi:hypothetical protein [Aeromicrobium sp. IC_218]|uniref:hypothetical protein n=1 Tax=Aeromicrobium sp. IC_218 TaxID=2545468 RepID=UPI00103A535F|nr:hypothetical protein [Aeromicrobium sp. IC_218]TCJ00625.1 hypothetical protein E0W78_00585 [Aeromicrobium sp. IC_218]